MVVCLLPGHPAARAPRTATHGLDHPTVDKPWLSREHATAGYSILRVYYGWRQPTKMHLSVFSSTISMISNSFWALYDVSRPSGPYSLFAAQSPYDTSFGRHVRFLRNSVRSLERLFFGEPRGLCELRPSTTYSTTLRLCRSL